MRKTEPSGKPLMTGFQPVKDWIRKPGIGRITGINDRLFESRCSPFRPDGKRRARNI